MIYLLFLVFENQKKEALEFLFLGNSYDNFYSVSTFHFPALFL